MNFRALFIGLLTAFSTTACVSVPPPRDARKIMDDIPDYTVTDPKTGCLYVSDPHDKSDTPKPCLINDFPLKPR